MSHTLATPTATTSLRGWFVRLWNDPESRSTLIGILGAVLIHLLILLLGPLVFRMEPTGSAVRPHATPREFNIELTSDSFVKPEEKEEEPFKFVEANPEAPENTPDRTPNFAARNQQVAQETPTPDGKSDRPATEGKAEQASTQIVSGRLTTPLEHLEAIAPPVDVPPAESMVSATKAAQSPLSGFEKIEGENEDAIGTNIAKPLENSQLSEEQVDGVKDVPLIQGAIAMQPVIDPKRPRPRPQITQTVKARPAILSENKFGTQNIGNIAVDAKWSNYGAYLQRMIDTVQIQWERFLVQWSANPSIGSIVTVKFVLNAEGKIAHIVNVDTTANETATRACVSAIADPAPYGEWTDDMKALLGDDQEMTFTFYYQ